MHHYDIVPERTALLNIDLQCCFVENSPVAAPRGVAVLQKANRITERCRAAGIKIIHTRHVVRDDHSNIGLLAKLPPVAGGIIDDSAGSSQLHPDLLVQPGDIVLKKPRFGAFQGTDLDNILRTAGIDTVIIEGITTNHCCEMTAREANARDFGVIFISDATATFDHPGGHHSGGHHPGARADEIQRATLATLGFAFAQIVDSFALLDLLDTAPRQAAAS